MGKESSDSELFQSREHTTTILCLFVLPTRLWQLTDSPSLFLSGIYSLKTLCSLIQFDRCQDGATSSFFLLVRSSPCICSSLCVTIEMMIDKELALTSHLPDVSESQYLPVCSLAAVQSSSLSNSRRSKQGARLPRAVQRRSTTPWHLDEVVGTLQVYFG